MSGARWVEVTASPFAHEAEGLAQIRALLPDAPPFRAWSNVEFRDSSGKWSEVDLLVLGRSRLHLVELKYYSGLLRGNDLTWHRDGRPAEDSPLKLARRKAQRLASRLHDEAERWARETRQQLRDVRDALPYVQECVYLHHPSFRSALPVASQQDLFGLVGGTARSGLPGIDERLLESGQPGRSVDRRTELPWPRAARRGQALGDPAPTRRAGPSRVRRPAARCPTPTGSAVPAATARRGALSAPVCSARTSKPRPAGAPHSPQPTGARAAPARRPGSETRRRVT